MFTCLVSVCRDKEYCDDDKTHKLTLIWQLSLKQKSAFKL